MSYLINKIEESELTDFLLNPYKKTTYLGDTLIQKYPKSELIDDIIYILNGSASFDLVGVVNYGKGNIAIYKDYFFSHEVRKQPQFVSLYDLRDDLVSEMEMEIEKQKNDKLAEIKASTDYMNLYDEYKGKFLEKIILDILGSEAFYVDVRSSTSRRVSRFVNSLKNKELMAIISGKRDEVNEEIKSILESENFILCHIVIPTLVEEAKEAVETGDLSERLATIKNYIDKTKECEAIRFTVETTAGSKFSCNNKVLNDGTVISVGDVRYEIDVENIEKVTYKNKVIYKKGVI